MKFVWGMVAGVFLGIALYITTGSVEASTFVMMGVIALLAAVDAIVGTRRVS